jgi:predicted nucleic acid-binding protein
VLVVDASVAVLWFVPQANADLATTVLASGLPLGAPGRLRLEAASALLRAVRRREMDEAQARRIVDVLIPASVDFIDHPEDEREAFGLAVTHGGLVYDGLYVAVAGRLGATLVTGDQRMHRTARAAGVKARLLTDGPPW